MFYSWLAKSADDAESIPLPCGNYFFEEQYLFFIPLMKQQFSFAVSKKECSLIGFLFLEDFVGQCE